MILVLGSHQDDILYCASLLNNRTSERLMDRFPMQKGTIFNQEVLLVHGVHTAILASSVVTYVLSHYYINLVFVVGKCFSVNKSFKKGDIIISKEIYDIDVDQIDVANAMLNQVPGLPPVYRVQKDVIGYLRDGFSRRTLVTPQVASFICSDNLYSPAVEKSLARKGSQFGDNGPFVLDSISFGCALAGYLNDVPIISCKAVEREVGENKSIDSYLSALDTYVDIGKAIVYTIGDIGRSDVLRVRRGV